MCDNPLQFFPSLSTLQRYEAKFVRFPFPLFSLSSVIREYIAPFRKACRQRDFLLQLAATALALVVSLLGLTHFLDAVERRPGAVLSDPVLALFPAIELTWLTFIMIYAGLVIALVVLLHHPDRLLLAAQVYVLMIVVRIVAMTLTPLDPPTGIIVLRDPFVEFFGTGQTLTRDLFFSGHTATLFLFSRVVPGRALRIFFLLATSVVGAAVILQHVHYAIDVFSALFFAYGCYHIALALRRVSSNNTESGTRL